MKIAVTFINSKGEAYEWAIDHEKPLEVTIELLKQHYDCEADNFRCQTVETAKAGDRSPAHRLGPHTRARVCGR